MVTRMLSFSLPMGRDSAAADQPVPVQKDVQVLAPGLLQQVFRRVQLQHLPDDFRGVIRGVADPQRLPDDGGDFRRVALLKPPDFEIHVSTSQTLIFVPFPQYSRPGPRAQGDSIRRGKR